MGKYFGTDGVRGEANVELTPEMAFKLGRFGGDGGQIVQTEDVVKRNTRIDRFL